MMGVYITNMELPTDGVRVVEIHPDGKVFTRRGNKIGDAIEIASPHGNLIDEDEIYDVDFYKVTLTGLERRVVIGAEK